MKKYNQEAAEKTLSAYETSTDYDWLYELAKQGYKIPCFLWSSIEYSDDLYFRIAKCFKFGNSVEICEMGTCFVADTGGLERFKRECERLEVRFIVPNVEETEK